MPDCSHPDPASCAAPWQASLRLAFASEEGVTRLRERRHSGPLRVQKTLYPEGPGHCHVIVVHPPGGVAGGDSLDIGMRLAPGAGVFATTPGAAKWYRANGRTARQRVALQLEAGAALEWMPQETILYDDADVVLEHEVDLAPDAAYIGLEILCFGRQASGEAFLRGQVRQHTRIRQAGRPVWWEQGRLDPAGIASSLGMRGHRVCATLLAAGRPLPPALMAKVRESGSGIAASQVRSVFVARLLADDSERAREAMLGVWQVLRPHYLAREARTPRIWQT